MTDEMEARRYLLGHDWKREGRDMLTNPFAWRDPKTGELHLLTVALKIQRQRDEQKERLK